MSCFAWEGYLTNGDSFIDVMERFMGKKKILIVDDHEKIRQLVRVTIRIDDYQILEAASGDEALKVAREHQPDLIFLDVMMPDGSIDGFEVCRILKSDIRTKNTHILILTALDRKEDYEQSQLVGADGYFTKPFSPLQLINKVEEVLGDKVVFEDKDNLKSGTKS